MKVYFSHGKESGPRGTKIQRLAEMAENMGCAVDSVDYTDLMDPDLRVDRLLEALAEEEGDFVLVGSSMGGYVSLVASESVDAKAVFLMAPALYMPGCGAARKAVMPTSMHYHERYANNRAEVSHEHTRAQERQMRRFKSSGQAQRFLTVQS